MQTTTDVPRGSSPEAIRQHYDVSNDFYRLWLDDTMAYSCALWADGDRDDLLEQAQLRKIDYHIHQARVRPGARILDVGCGWGTLLRRAVEVHGAAQAVGLTLSPNQAAWSAARPDPRVEVRLESWADHQPVAPYDAIVSVGAFEHFARPEWETAEKVAAYRAFFTRCRDWLKPDGWLSLQTIAYGNVNREEFRDVPGRRFLLGEVFPESELPTIADVMAASAGLFEIVMLRNDREDYRRTCLVWLGRLTARRAEAAAIVGEEVLSRYLRYLKLSSVLFRDGQCFLLRWTLRRVETPWL